MRVDLVGSLIITLFLMLIANIFNLSIFGCILLMIFSFFIFSYRYLLLGYWRRSIGRISFRKKVIPRARKSSYEDLEVDKD